MDASEAGFHALVTRVTGRDGKPLGTFDGGLGWERFQRAGLLPGRVGGTP